LKNKKRETRLDISRIWYGERDRDRVFSEEVKGSCSPHTENSSWNKFCLMRSTHSIFPAAMKLHAFRAFTQKSCTRRAVLRVSRPALQPAAWDFCPRTIARKSPPERIIPSQLAIEKASIADTRSTASKMCAALGGGVACCPAPPAVRHEAASCVVGQLASQLAGEPAV